MVFVFSCFSKSIIKYTDGLYFLSRMKIESVEYRLQSFSLSRVISILSIFQIGIIFLFSYILESIDNSLTEVDFLQNLSLVNIFILSVIIAPIVETFIFQFFLIEFFQFTLNKTKYIKHVSILVAGILFGLTHNYNIYYVLVMIVIGVYFAWVYWFISKWKGISSAFWSVTLIHAISNLIGFIVDELTM